MARTRKSFEYVSETATSDDGLNLKQKAQFHYFNPNGLHAQKKALDEQISRLVDAGVVPSGWLLAYGSFDEFYVKELRKFVINTSHPNKIKLQVTLQSLRERNNKIAAQIAEVEQH